jgi:hypothetical protein
VNKRTPRAVWVREDRAITLDEIRWLASAEGRAVCAEMATEGPESPALLGRWRERLQPDLVAAAAQQIDLRRRAAAKFSRADLMLFDRVGLEQATDETIARWKARRFSDFGSVADLCCGIGGDTLAFASLTRTLAIDWSAIKLALAAHNVHAYGSTAETRVADVAVERPEADAVHIDPDRRVFGPRRHDPEAGSPDLAELRRIVNHYSETAVKLSPGADFDLLGFDAEIELISHQGECRQAVAWTGRLATCHRRATVLPAGETIEASADTPLDWPAPEPLKSGHFLLEPDPAVIRANLVGVFAGRHGLAPIDPQVSWLTGETGARNPLARSYRIIDVSPWSLTKGRTWLRGHDVGPLEIKTRGFAGSPEEIRRRLRLAGRQSRVLLLTRLGEQPTAILAERITA